MFVKLKKAGVYISDIAGRVARHVNNRTQQKMFHPHDGRICEPTEENISLATAGELSFNPDWVKNIKMKRRLAHKQSAEDRISSLHPETGTSERFAFYDRFHQKNQKRPEERLRSLKLIPELASLVNSSEAEQVNRELSTKTHTRPMETQGTPQGQTGAEETGVNFSVAMFPVDPSNKEKISKLYAVQRREEDTVARISPYAILSLRDLKTILPPHLLTESSSTAMPWLTDNVVNCRIEQIALQANDVLALDTNTYILWYRDCAGVKGEVTVEHLKRLQVFDLAEKEIRVYDNTRRYKTISAEDMVILKNEFRNVDKLDGWTVSSPNQWQRDDGRNCGVFVCTMAEMEAKNIKMNNERLHNKQLGYLRLYHASYMVRRLQPQNFPREVDGTKEKNSVESKSAAQNSCMAQEAEVCLYQTINSKTLALLKEGLMVHLVIEDNEILTEAIIERVYEVTQLARDSMENTSYILDVMTPEVNIMILLTLLHNK
ncbi:hypothetical protein IRJ41_006757 [Triplophysa rosa]|uniref:Ubiquitin-like protease family profile domain-containing protein n=1 Tax=Triplophysa rosa TaxID=992332 RepID=A0A9W7T9E6_TRIRA|nr:hypothetical protein IRJ41_006757 [Triplophysa rosa]